MKYFINFSILLNILSNLFSTGLKATTHTTLSSGYWSSPSTWQSGIAPPLTTSDTIIIRNFVEFSSEIVLIAPAHLVVDSSGALCGHDTIFSNSGTSITTYGILEVDVLEVPGGQILFYPPGHIILSQYAHLSNGASLHSSAGVAVGPWFNCITKTDAVGEIDNSGFVLFPNPANELLTFVTTLSFDEFIITDISGKIILRGIPEMKTINVSSLAEGFYILSLKSREGVFQKKFFKK